MSVASPIVIKEVSKAPDETRDYAFNWEDETFNLLMLGTEYVLGARVRPSVVVDLETREVTSQPNGFEYEVTVGGQSDGKRLPKLPIVLGATVATGSITLTCVALSTAGLRKRISTSTWTPEDVSVVVDSNTFNNTAGSQATLSKISGGTDEATSDVLNHVVFDDGTKIDAILRMTI